jgi:hypothetical protein
MWPLAATLDMHSILGQGKRAVSRVRDTMTCCLTAYRFFHPPLCPGAPPEERGAGPNSGPDWRGSVGLKILLPVLGPSSREGLRVVAWPGIGQRLRAGRPARQDMSFQITSLKTNHPVSHATNPTPPPRTAPAMRCLRHSAAPRMAPSSNPGLPSRKTISIRLTGSLRMPMSDTGSYLFLHPPLWPGAPPLERGAGPNSGPDWRESMGWKILLPVLGLMSSGAGLRDGVRPGR